jgi:hypothetical protein
MCKKNNIKQQQFVKENMNPQKHSICWNETLKIN